jgi:hypothetical protein
MNITAISAACNQCRPAINVAIPNATGILVIRVTSEDHPTAQVTPQYSDLSRVDTGARSIDSD